MIGLSLFARRLRRLRAPTVGISTWYRMAKPSC